MNFTNLFFFLCINIYIIKSYSIIKKFNNFYFINKLSNKYLKNKINSNDINHIHIKINEKSKHLMNKIKNILIYIDENVVWTNSEITWSFVDLKLKDNHIDRKKNDLFEKDLCGLDYNDLHIYDF